MATPKPDNTRKKRVPWNWAVLLVALGFLYLLNVYVFSSGIFTTIPYDEFLRRVQAGSITEVQWSDDRLYGESKTADGKSPERFLTVAPSDKDLLPLLLQKNVTLHVQPKETVWGTLLSWLFPLLGFYLVWLWFTSKAGSTPTGLLSMTKSRVRTTLETEVKTTFADVAGVDEAKQELSEIVNFLQNPKRYTRLGGRAPKGVLLVGAPGTGKTLLARAVAGEAKVPFFSINGSEFVEMFVGLGAARVRDLFDQARRQAPCILFIDEIDALGKSRALGVMGTGSSDEKEQTLNQLLAEMDGFDTSEGVIMLAATNRPEILDPALLRAGRFDRQILLAPPDQIGRLQILSVHVRKIKLDESVDLQRIAAMTSGFTGADLANIVNEAAIVATRRAGESVIESDFSEAIERILAGLEKKTRVMSAAEKRRIACHELGHATVALALRVPERIQKISIIPRGFSALGYTLQRPLEDRYLMDEQELLDKLSVLLGGRAAESVLFPHVSTGAADDLSKASDLARSMVVRFGMSAALGLETFDVKGAPYLQSEYDFAMRKVSEGTAHAIDLEVKSILDRAMTVAVGAILHHRNFIDRALDRLLATETLDEQEITRLWQEGVNRTLNEPSVGETHV